ncbi:hypothetical protein MSM1_01085 [Mycobacterium sp. SM1]|uniref:hypothetical protein n=1 Tax=Mycobacterium sp. SM1 TaxID=2816243 RepID=UPI001BCEF9ED|nr:hypothetical protein [Mycobacterium sp. SM1]MBS4727022.1 hypothetical protein [Mycobacterium sp. SM1]
MPVVTALPTVSQAQAMDTAHLREAAQYWERTATLWDEVFTTIHQRVSAPGGVPWEGQAAAREQERSLTDMLKVRPVSLQLYETAGIARRGDEALPALRDEVLEAMADARADGFDVGEDYSVTDRSRGGSSAFRAARQSAARGHSAFMRHRVAALVAKDHEIASEIAETTAGIDHLTFLESPGVDDTVVGDEKHNGVQLVDNKTRNHDCTAQDPATLGRGNRWSSSGSGCNCPLYSHPMCPPIPFRLGGSKGTARRPDSPATCSPCSRRACRHRNLADTANATDKQPLGAGQAQPRRAPSKAPLPFPEISAAPTEYETTSWPAPQPRRTRENRVADHTLKIRAKPLRVVRHPTCYPQTQNRRGTSQGCKLHG